MPAGYLKTGTEHLSTIAGRRIIQVAREGVESSPNIDVERHSCSMMNMRTDQQARLSAIREQMASIAAQSRVLWLSTPGAETAAPAETGLVPAQMQLEATKADLMPAGADQGSAEAQLVSAEAPQVSPEVPQVSPEVPPVPAEARLEATEAGLVPAEAGLVPAETPLVSARARPADTARNRHLQR
jgi:hypothetical protein